MSQPYSITGLKGVYPRREIRDLAEDEKQFCLFIHALQAIKQPDYRPKAARFQDLGGIHGLPYERWSGDPNAPDALPEGNWGGYCNHQSVLFPVWHRPYVLAVEQSIGEAAIRIARRWIEDAEHISEEDKAAWTDAAKSLRFPFWDWTDKSTETEGLPDVLKPQVFQFELPGSTAKDPILSDPIENPLAFHEFAPKPDGFQDQIFSTSMAKTGAMSYFKSWDRTYRWPSSKFNPIEDYVKINKLLRGAKDSRGSAKQLRGAIGNLFCYPAPGEVPDEHQFPSLWDEFSNTLFESKKAGWGATGCGSIESPHNTVHLVLGGLGDMANNDYAGFDPIFYLHHCNIDRILAFWEYTYHRYWVDLGYFKKGGDGKPIPFTQPDGTWDEPNNANIDRNTGLQPFRNGDGEYWTADQTRFFNKSSILDTGYTYPDIVAVIGEAEYRVRLSDPLPETDTEVHEAMTIIQTHFGVHKKPAVLRPEHQIAYHSVPLGHRLVPQYHRFYIFVELVAHAFGGSYSLEVLYDKRVIGTFAVLTRGDATQCASCRIRRKAGGEVRGIVDIPDETLQDIAESIEEGEDLVQALAEAIRTKVTVRLVDAAGNLLAGAVASVGAPGLMGDDGRRLEETITPKVHLWSAGAIRKIGDASESTRDGKLGLPSSNGSPELGLTFFNHQNHGDLLSGPVTWVPN